MPILAEESRGLVALVALAAAAVGVLCGLDPRIGIAAAVGLAVMMLVLGDLTFGVYCMCFLAFLDILPTASGLSLSKVVGILLVISWLATVATRRGVPNLFAERPGLIYLLGFFVAWVVLSLSWAEDRGATLTSIGRYVPNLFLIPIVYSALRERRHAVWMIGALAIGAAATGALALVAPVSDPSAVTGDTARATSTIGDANELAMALVVGLFLALALLLDRARSGPVRAAAGVAIPVCLGGIFLSLSRGGLIALAVASLTAVVFSGRWRAKAAVAAAVVLSATFFYFAFFASLPAKERVTAVGNGSGRVDLWTVGWRMVTAHPVQGIGSGNFPISSIHYLLRPGAIQRADFIIVTPKIAHNTYLQVLSELGVVGGAAFIGIVGFSLVCMVRAAREAVAGGDEELEILSRGVLAATVGLLSASFFISENYSKLVWLMLALGPALLALVRRTQGARPRRS